MMSDSAWKECIKNNTSHQGDLLGEHNKFSLSEWKTEITNNITRLGYWEWVAIKVTSDNQLKELNND